MNLRVSHSWRGGIAIVRIEGELDQYTDGQARKAFAGVLADERLEHVVADISSLTMPGYEHFRVFGNVLQALRRVRVGGRLILAGADEHIRKMSVLTGLQGVFQIADSVDEALEWITDGPTFA